MSEENTIKRNLKPHKAAIVAMALYNREYAKFGGGSMDFWDSLTEGQKRTCHRILTNIEQAPKGGTVFPPTTTIKL